VKSQVRKGCSYGNLRRTTATAVQQADTLEVPSEALAHVLAEQLHEPAELLQLLCRQAQAPESRAQHSEIQSAEGRSTQARPSRLGEVVDKKHGR
jgi:hypothetical protein